MDEETCFYGLLIDTKKRFFMQLFIGILNLRYRFIRSATFNDIAENLKAVGRDDSFRVVLIRRESIQDVVAGRVEQSLTGQDLSWSPSCTAAGANSRNLAELFGFMEFKHVAAGPIPVEGRV